MSHNLEDSQQNRYLKVVFSNMHCGSQASISSKKYEPKYHEAILSISSAAVESFWIAMP